MCVNVINDIVFESLLTVSIVLCLHGFPREHVYHCNVNFIIRFFKIEN